MVRFNLSSLLTETFSTSQTSSINKRKQMFI